MDKIIESLKPRLKPDKHTPEEIVKDIAKRNKLKLDEAESSVPPEPYYCEQTYTNKYGNIVELKCVYTEFDPEVMEEPQVTIRVVSPALDIMDSEFRYDTFYYCFQEGKWTWYPQGVDESRCVKDFLYVWEMTQEQLAQMRNLEKLRREFHKILDAIYADNTQMRLELHFRTYDPGKPIRFDFRVIDCEHTGDIRAEENRLAPYLRKHGGKIVDTYWDGHDCGEAYVTVEIPYKALRAFAKENIWSWGDPGNGYQI